MNPREKIPALKALMPNDPTVEILDGLCQQTSVIAGKIISIEECGFALRYTRVWAFFLMFCFGSMSGWTSSRYVYEKPDSLAPFKRAGVRAIIADDGDDLYLTMRGDPVKEVHAEYDNQKNKVGFTVVYHKESQP